MTHTPGPWTVDKVQAGSYVWAGEMMVAGIRGWGHLTGKGAMGLPESEAVMIQVANSHLIAAAPDLLEALEAARSELEEYAIEYEGEGYNNPRINAAIAKAKGGTK